MSFELIDYTKDAKNQIEDSRGIDAYLYLIDNHDKDLLNLNLMYDGIENMWLRECEITNIILDKQILNGKFFEREDALLNLDCHYWVKFLDDSKIRDLMPYTEYVDLLGKFKTRDKNNHIPFNEITVTAFIEKLIDSKPLLFANKVNTLLGELDYSYKNNQGSMLPAMMILETNYAILPSWQNSQKIDDLRYSLRQIYGMSLEFEKTDKVFQYNDAGVWVSLDDDLIRVKRFKNANAHILLSDVAYDKLNEIISLVNSNILPESCKKIRKKTYKKGE